MKKVLLFTIAMLFALVAKATPTITPIAGDDKGYTITINEPADFEIFNSSDNVFYTEKDGTEIKVSEIKELVIVTKNPHKLGKDKATALLNNCTSLDILDLENCDVAGVTETGDANPFLSNGNPNPFKNRLKTLVFPKTAGMIIPTSAFEGDTELETVVFPDNNGTYQIMSYAFRDSKVKTVSLGKGYSIPDMAQNNDGNWSSETGSGLSIFEHCKELVNVVLDNSITNLGEKAFSATYALEYLILPENLVHIGNLCFKECGIKTVTIPDNVIIGKRDQIFQGCIQLRNIFVNADNIEVPIQGLMEMAQTFNFKWAGHEQTCSINDYQSASPWTGSDYQDSPFRNQYYSVPILHYPGTNTAINNYRCPFYMHYSGKHDATDTTWPNSKDLGNKENGSVNDVDYYGGSYTGFYNTPGFAPEESEFAGWKQFLIGNNIFKEQKVFYDERIKESRWYSICLPINMTEAQFMNAYGVGAELKEFSGAVYDENEKMIILNFDKDAEVKNGYLLQKGVPYMIHPAKIKFSKRKEITYGGLDGSIEFQKVTEDGQEDYVTTNVIATFDVESDLFINWNTVLVGGDPFDQAVEAILTNTKAALEANSVTKSLTISGSNPDNIQPADFNFIGSYLGAAVWGPVTKYIGTSPTLPKGAYYLGYDPDHGINTPQFFKSKGIATWSPYCALVNASAPVASGAKEFDTLDIDFNGLSDNIVVTGIGNPTIQIPVTFTNDKVYNLNGQVVRENSKDLSGLKGIFIVGGKKVVIK